MKNNILSILAILVVFPFTIQISFAQAPEKMSYQAIVRDASGVLLKSAPVGFRFSIIQGSATGIEVYVEIQTVTTNPNGLATTAIGSGAVMFGSIDDIDWKAGPYFIRTETDPAGGTSYTINSTTQLLSVPYALFSKVSERSLNDTILYAKMSGTTFKDTVHYAELSRTTMKDTVTYAKFSGITASNGDTLVDRDVQLGGTLNRPTEIRTNATNTLAVSGLQTGETSDSILTVAPGTGVIRKQLLHSLFWSTKGNVGTNPDSNFIGTADNKNLVFRRNNIKAGVLSDSNTALGVNALNSNTYGFNNLAIGNNALSDNTTGYQNTAVGFNALSKNTTGVYNTAVGVNALRFNKSGMWNTAVGWMSLDSTNTGSGNTAIGFHALRTNSTGSTNVAVGYEALRNNRNGIDNTAVGSFSLEHNTSGSDNVALGSEAMFNNYTGSYNISIGLRSLYFNDTGKNNIAVGTTAMGNNYDGYNNTAVGFGALSFNFSGYHNTAIGTSADVNGMTLHNASAFGNSALVNANNKVRIGDVNVTVIEGQVAYSYPSDARFKTNIKNDVPGLVFIKQLKPVTYNFDTRKYDLHLMQHFPDSVIQKRINNKEYVVSSGTLHSGFLAQDVESTCKALGFDFDGLHIPDPGNPSDHYSLAYSQFIMPLVKAVQEQQALIEKLEQRIAELEKK